MNHALIFKHLSRSICINLLNYLELRLDFLPSSLQRKNGPPLYIENKPLLQRRDLVEVDVDVSKVRFGRVQPAVSLITSLVAPLVDFFYKASLVLLPLDGKGADL